MRKRKMQAGYTLIELVTTMAVVSVLSAFGVQKFANLHDDARSAGAFAIAGALGSASANNALMRTRGPSPSTAAIANCADAASLLIPGSMGTYSIESKPVAPGTTENCVVQHLGQATGATFVAYGAN